MALEQAGQSLNIKKLKEKLQKRFPQHNFDVAPKPDTRCKAPYFCKDNTIKYTDVEGNTFCGLRYKETDDKDPYRWEYKVCHALIKPVDIQAKHKEDEVELF